MELRDYLRLLQRRWVTIFVVLVACLGGAAAVTAYQTPTYRTSTQILVALPNAGITANNDTPAAQVTNLPSVVSSFATLVSSPQAVSAAMAAAGVSPSAGVAVEASGETGTPLLDISVVSGDPTAAQAVANAFVSTFPTVLVELQQLGSPTALSFTTLAEAGLPASPSSPDPVVNTAIGLALGLALGIAVAVAREALDRRIRDSRGIEERVGVTVLGVVPHELGKAPLPTVTHPDSARTEAYRKVRTNLLFSGPEGMVRSLAITSAVAGEGKSSLATNLAVVCAQAGQRVALVDADLRKPTVHTRFGLSNAEGLTTVLAGEANLEDVILTERHGISVITSGPKPRDPSAMLESPLFRKVVAELETTYDIVIIDTTPLLAVSDAAQVCTVCEGAVVVSRLRRTTYDSVIKARTTLERVRRPALGVVAVGHDEDPDAGYRYYYEAASEPTAGSASHRKDGNEQPTEQGGWRLQGRSS